MNLNKNSLASSTTSSSSLSSSSSTSSIKRISADNSKGKGKGNGKDKASLHSFWRKRQREDRPSPDAFVDDERSHAQRRVACPACGVSMPLLKVDEHLARHCLARSEQDSQSKCGAAENASQVAFLGQFHRARGPELITVRAKGSREERALTNQDLERLACPFEIVPGAVAADLAADLAKMLMREAKASWKPSVWTVFNNTGGTNRLSATYRFDKGTVTRERERRDAVDEDANKDADPTHVTPESTLRRLEESSEAMQNLVRERFAARCERGLARSHKGDDAYVAAWKPSFALCNYYRDGTDGIAFHSDYLTTLGPRAIVAALSLGSTRYFRWHKIESDTKQISEVYTARVPHNHAIIMWPGAQESWKHGVPTQSHESIGAHPLTQLARISLTFRMRRPMIASQAPKCTCGRSAALKYSVKASRYFFKCNPNSTQTCEFFEWFER